MVQKTHGNPPSKNKGRIRVLRKQIASYPMKASAYIAELIQCMHTRKPRLVELRKVLKTLEECRKVGVVRGVKMHLDIIDEWLRIACGGAGKSNIDVVDWIAKAHKMYGGIDDSTVTENGNVHKLRDVIEAKLRAQRKAAEKEADEKARREAEAEAQRNAAEEAQRKAAEKEADEKARREAEAEAQRNAAEAEEAQRNAVEEAQRKAAEKEAENMRRETENQRKLDEDVWQTVGLNEKEENIRPVESTGDNAKISWRDRNEELLSTVRYRPRNTVDNPQPPQPPQLQPNNNLFNKLRNASSSANKFGFMRLLDDARGKSSLNNKSPNGNVNVSPNIPQTLLSSQPTLENQTQPTGQSTQEDPITSPPPPGQSTQEDPITSPPPPGQSTQEDPIKSSAQPNDDIPLQPTPETPPQTPITAQSKTSSRSRTPRQNNLEFKKPSVTPTIPLRTSRTSREQEKTFQGTPNTSQESPPETPPNSPQNTQPSGTTFGTVPPHPRVPSSGWLVKLLNAAKNANNQTDYINHPYYVNVLKQTPAPSISNTLQSPPEIPTELLNILPNCINIPTDDVEIQKLIVLATNTIDGMKAYIKIMQTHFPYLDIDFSETSAADATEILDRFNKLTYDCYKAVSDNIIQTLENIGVLTSVVKCLNDAASPAASPAASTAASPAASTAASPATSIKREIDAKKRNTTITEYCNCSSNIYKKLAYRTRLQRLARMLKKFTNNQSMYNTVNTILANIGEQMKNMNVGAFVNALSTMISSGFGELSKLGKEALTAIGELFGISFSFDDDGCINAPPSGKIQFIHTINGRLATPGDVKPPETTTSRDFSMNETGDIIIHSSNDDTENNIAA